MDVFTGSYFPCIISSLNLKRPSLSFLMEKFLTLISLVYKNNPQIKVFWYMAHSLLLECVGSFLSPLWSWAGCCRAMLAARVKAASVFLPREWNRHGVLCWL